VQLVGRIAGKPAPTGLLRCFSVKINKTNKRKTTVAAEIQDSRSARFALRCSNWAERWFPDSWVFAALAVMLVCIGALAMGAKPTDTAKAFGDGFWSLIPFTMQMAFVVIGGYVVASSPPPRG
jgi:short-chain fatty acids transporter